MSGNNLKTVYWDACIFLALLKNEKREDERDLLGIKEQQEAFDRNELRIVTSVLSLPEILESSLSPQKQQEFRAIRQRAGTFRMVQVTAPIAQLAHDIRNYYVLNRANKNDPSLSIPDAVHLATAILYRCEVFYTFDGEHDTVKRGRLTLLPLNNNVAGQYRLPIMKPEPSPEEEPDVPDSRQLSIFDEVGENGDLSAEHPTPETRESKQ